MTSVQIKHHNDDEKLCEQKHISFQPQRLSFGFRRIGAMDQGIVAEGQYTSVVYGAIRDQQYHEAVKILNYELQV